MRGTKPPKAILLTEHYAAYGSRRHAELLGKRYRRDIDSELNLKMTGRSIDEPILSDTNCVTVPLPLLGRLTSEPNGIVPVWRSTPKLTRHNIGRVP